MLTVKKDGQRRAGLADLWRELEAIRVNTHNMMNVLSGQRENKGDTWGNSFTLTVAAAPIRLFFTTDFVGSNSLPAGLGLYIPTFAFRVLVVINEGNADIMFDVNKRPGHTQFTTVLRAGENVQIPPSGSDIDKFSIFSFQAIAITPGGPNPATTNTTSWNGDLTTAHIRLMAVT